MKYYGLFCLLLLTAQSLFAGTVMIDNQTDGQIKVMISFSSAPNAWIPNVLDQAQYIAAKTKTTIDTQKMLCPTAIQILSVNGRAANQQAEYQPAIGECHDVIIDVTINPQGMLTVKEH